MFKIFGYGTFITKKKYKDSSKVQPGYLSGYFRVYNPNGWFPYVLKDDGSMRGNKSGFWGLVFEVNKEKLAQLDRYEGKDVLYDRIIEKVSLKDGQNVECYLYYPTRNTIENNNLYDLIKLGDGWRKKIVQEYPEIIRDFPELQKTEF